MTKLQINYIRIRRMKFINWIRLFLAVLLSTSYWFGGTKALCVSLAFISLGFLLLYVYQDKLIYMPYKPFSLKIHQRRFPGQLNVDYENMEVITEDGLRLRGWVFLHPKPQRIIIYFHGNSKHISFKIPFCTALKQQTKSIVICIAYRGYSESEGKPSELGLKADARAVIKKVNEYRNEQWPQLEISVLGKSLGGAVAISVCSEPEYRKHIKAVILENTFTQLADVVQNISPIFKLFRRLLKNQWKSINLIKQITIPILFIKSVKDRLIPKKQMDQLMSNALKSQYIEQYLIEQGTHHRTWRINVKEYFDSINRFLKSVNHK